MLEFTSVFNFTIIMLKKAKEEEKEFNMKIITDYLYRIMQLLKIIMISLMLLLNQNKIN